MKSLLYFLLLTSISLYTVSKFDGSTTSGVTLVGGIIKAKHVDQSNKKYKRKDCPVCKGKGWYMSGDGIKKIECTYCEPDTKSEPISSKTDDCQTRVIKK